MRGLRSGVTQMTPTVAGHFDKCLGCMACVTACPSGVRYDILIEETRAMVEKTYRRGLFDRLHRAMIFSLFPYPRRLKAALEFARALMRKFDGAEAILINAAGCGSHLKDYGRLFGTEEARAFSAKVRDINEFLAALPPRAERKPLALRIAMHDACHLQHAQR